MEAVRGYYDGYVFVPIEPVNAKKNQQAIVTILDSVECTPLSAEAVSESPNHECKLGFLKDNVPELPDSFFDPLPEEDLQAWGL